MKWRWERGGRVTFGQVKASNPTINFMDNFMGKFHGLPEKREQA
jgi:hypothetical protein